MSDRDPGHDPPPAPEATPDATPAPAAPASEVPAPAVPPPAAITGAPLSGTPGRGTEVPPARAPAPEPDASAPAPAPAPPRRSWLDTLAERPETTSEVPRRRLASQSRRDFLLWGAGVAATLLGGWWLLPDRVKSRLAGGVPRRDWLDTLAARVGLSRARRERLLERSLTFDDDVAEALYSKDRRVRTYARSQVTPLRNNYHGRTPGPEILPAWRLEISGLAGGGVARLTLEDIERRFTAHDQVTRLVCVEGWSAIAWWGGIRFADLLAAFPPAAGARWAALRSEVALDAAGRPEPYYVSLDLETALHPQTLLATRKDGQPLSLAHGAPLRLVAPMKLGLKNIKAITHIVYGAGEPPDYWNERGYSRYDGL